MMCIVGSRIEVPCAILVLEVLKVFSYRFEDVESNDRGLTSGKCGELSLEGVFQNGGQNTLIDIMGPKRVPKQSDFYQILFIMMLWDYKRFKQCKNAIKSRRRERFSSKFRKMHNW